MLRLERNHCFRNGGRNRGIDEQAETVLFQRLFALVGTIGEFYLDVESTSETARSAQAYASGRWIYMAKFERTLEHCGCFRSDFDGQAYRPLVRHYADARSVPTSNHRAS